MFSLPNLPREWYFKMKELCTALEITQWQAVIVGLAAIVELGKRDEPAVREIIADIKARYSKGSRIESVDRP